MKNLQDALQALESAYEDLYTATEARWLSRGASPVQAQSLAGSATVKCSFCARAIVRPKFARALSLKHELTIVATEPGRFAHERCLHAKGDALTCPDCGGTVSGRGWRKRNMVERPDGRLAHVQCTGFRAEEREAEARQRREHRDAVRGAVRDGAIR